MFPFIPFAQCRRHRTNPETAEQLRMFTSQRRKNQQKEAEAVANCHSTLDRSVDNRLL